MANGTPAQQGLTAAQSKAANAKGPTIVLAGAGTGKTTALTGHVCVRIAEGINPNRIFAATFTNKAANEMKERIQKKTGLKYPPYWVGTFHSMFGRILRMHPEMASLRNNFDVLDADDARKVLRRALKSLDMDAGKETMNAMAGAIDIFKDWLVAPEEAAMKVSEIVHEILSMNMRVSEQALAEAVPVYARYQQYLREGNAADFSDLIMWPTRAMALDERIRKLIASKFDVVMADEYQDVNHSQYRALMLLAADHRQIFVVGDDDQAIYGFRHANVAYIRRFPEEFPDAQMIRLEENFRSTGNILSAANAVIAGDTKRLGKTLYTMKGEGNPIEVLMLPSADEEAEQVAYAIRRRVRDGAKWSDMAILYRSNYLSRAFEFELSKSGIPYIIIGDVGFWQRQEVKDALALARLASMPDDPQSDESFRRVVNVPTRGIGEKKVAEIEAAARAEGISMLAATERMKFGPKTRDQIMPFCEAIRSVDADQPLSLQIQDAVEASGYSQMWRDSKADEADDRLRNISELVNFAGAKNSLTELLEHAALSGRESDEDEFGKVKLMSLHRSKGLEFPHVFLVGWEEGLFPSERSLWDNAEDEERRLAYVGITRAMQRCSITAAQWRPGKTGGGISRFVHDIPEEILHEGWIRD